MFWLAVFLGLPLVAIAYAVHKHNLLRQVLLSGQFAGPLAWPVIGNGLLFLNKSAIENFSVIVGLVRDYGDVVRIWIGPDLNVFLSNPADVEVLTSSPKFINKSSEYKYIKPWLSEGLLLSEGKKWHQRRKILTPAFHFKILEQFVEIFDRQSNTMMETLRKFAPGESIELYPIGTLYALDVICESAMGTTVDAQRNNESEYVLAVKEMTHVLHLRMFDFVLRIDAIFQFSELCRNMNRALNVLHGFTDSVIRDRRTELLQSQVTTNPEATVTNGTVADPLAGDTDLGTRRKMAFLDILLQAHIDGLPLTDLEIREEVDTFMFEGHDTTTSAITFTLYCIAKYPEVQRKCIEEIRRVMGDQRDKPVTFQELSSLHYLELVIKETLRLYPSVPLIGRQLIEETAINGRVYPAGCNIVVPIFSMGRNAKLFAEPHEFRPERFGADAALSDQKWNAFAYIPFSAGPRNCIGQKFAMLELKSVVSKTLRCFEIALAADSQHEPDMIAELILVPASRINFHLTERVY